VVPGNLPMGCSSAYLTLHPGKNRSDYDSVGCLKTYNDFTQHHNAVLQQKLQALRRKYPQARIMYADYYGASMSFAKNPKQFGECSDDLQLSFRHHGMSCPESFPYEWIDTFLHAVSVHIALLMRD
jgi:hypothetical protein